MRWIQTKIDDNDLFYIDTTTACALNALVEICIDKKHKKFQLGKSINDRIVAPYKNFKDLKAAKREGEKWIKGIVLKEARAINKFLKEK